MSLKLIYHSTSGGTSPFDDCAVEISRNAELLIACPYLSLDYLKRLIRLSKSWFLITDIEEWLSSVKQEDLALVCEFMKENASCVRHVYRIHAKVLIGNSSAMIGSANLTKSGIQLRTEMAVLVDDPNCYEELQGWFDDLWTRGEEIPHLEPDSFAILPDPVVQKRKSNLFENKEIPHASLKELEKDREIYVSSGRCSAKGYIPEEDGFCVLKGSEAKRSVTQAFNNRRRERELRERLIDNGILVLNQKWGPYEFARDYTFSSKSEAAYIVAGNPRSGPDFWRKRT